MSLPSERVRCLRARCCFVIRYTTMPVLIESLGLDRFGILTLIWTLISYNGHIPLAGVDGRA